MTAALILAAGASTRLGSPKQLVQLQGETLLDRAVRIAREAGCSPIYVVLGASAPLIESRCDLHQATVLVNEQWPEGMASSIRLGIAALSQTPATGVIILPCDMPAITSSHLRALTANGAQIASRYDNRNGIPAFFPRANFNSLLSLTGDHGARGLLQATPSLDLQNGQLDIDTPENIPQMHLLRPTAPNALHANLKRP